MCLWSAPKFPIHINANIYLVTHSDQVGHLQDPLMFRFGHQCLRPSKTLESFWTMVLYLQDPSAMHTSIWLTDHRCSNPWQWRRQYPQTRNLTFPDVRGFESLSLTSPVMLQGHALHPSGSTTGSSRFVRPGEVQWNNNLTLLWEKQTVFLSGLINLVEGQRKSRFHLVLSTTVVTA